MRFFSFSKKFNDPLTTGVYTTTHVIKERSPIVLVSHELDGAWQFMGAEDIEDYTKTGMVVSLEQIIKHDKSILKVADLPIGYMATRNSRSGKWEISKIEYSEDEMKQFGYHCSTCGIYHNEIPMSYGSHAPLLYFLIAEDQREQRCELTNDQCIIDEKHYYIRGILELAVEDSTEIFTWELWVEVSKKDFERMAEMWDEENRILEPPYHGEVDTQLEPYRQTCGLLVKVITQPIGFAPKLQLEESDHPLYLEQESGINMTRVKQFAEKILYKH